MSPSDRGTTSAVFAAGPGGTFVRATGTKPQDSQGSAALATMTRPSRYSLRTVKTEDRKLNLTDLVSSRPPAREGMENRSKREAQKKSGDPCRALNSRPLFALLFSFHLQVLSMIRVASSAPAEFWQPAVPLAGCVYRGILACSGGTSGSPTFHP